MKKDELHARVLYLYQILRHYSDSEHPLTVFGKMKVSQKVSKKLAPQMA